MQNQSGDIVETFLLKLADSPFFLIPFAAVAAYVLVRWATKRLDKLIGIDTENHSHQLTTDERAIYNTLNTQLTLFTEIRDLRRMIETLEQRAVIERNDNA